MRDVAEEYGVPLIDAGRELNKTPGIYFDSCHFDARGRESVAEPVRDAMEKAGAKLVASKH